MKKFFEEFKAFAMRGNVLDMAVGVVIGGAFGKITTSLVNDIIMPLISMLTGGVDFSAWKWVLKEAVMEGSKVVTPEVAVNYGNLIAVILDFIIIPSIFLLHVSNACPLSGKATVFLFFKTSITSGLRLCNPPVATNNSSGLFTAHIIAVFSDSTRLTTLSGYWLRRCSPNKHCLNKKSLACNE